MAKVKLRESIQAPVEQTFEAFSAVPEIANWISAITDMQVLTDGPVGVGTRFRETRVMYGKEATEEMEFTEYQPHQAYVVEAISHGVHYISRYQFRSNNGGTEVEVTFEGVPQSKFAKLMSPLASLMMGSVRKALQSDLADLKRHLESQAEA